MRMNRRHFVIGSAAAFAAAPALKGRPAFAAPDASVLKAGLEPVRAEGLHLVLRYRGEPVARVPAVARPAENGRVVFDDVQFTASGRSVRFDGVTVEFGEDMPVGHLPLAGEGTVTLGDGDTLTIEGPEVIFT